MAMSFRRIAIGSHANGSSAAFQLAEVLSRLGVPISGTEIVATSGFPFELKLSTGESLWVELPEPAMLANLDPRTVGVAIVNPRGFAVSTWGLAANLPLFQLGTSLLDSELLNLLAETWRGNPGVIFLNGYRFYAAPVGVRTQGDVFLLVTDAGDELSARRRASRSQRTAEALKRIGRALAMNQALQPMCNFAVQEIASSMGLAAALLWTRTSEDERFTLQATIGANRKGSGVLNVIDGVAGTTCIAELACASGRTIMIRDAADNSLAAELEARFCFLTPGQIMAIPLNLGGRKIGVLELVGRCGDLSLLESEDLVQTIAEHLALALNGALLFEATERLALFDPLTGIANQRALHGFLQRAIAEAKRLERPLGVLMADVDHFRSFNEEEGHDAGDQALVQVAAALKATVRPYDIAARYGGEEFTIVMPGAGVEETLAAAERIRAAIGEIEFVAESGRSKALSVSIGCAVFPQLGQDSAALLKAADMALYQAKRTGRNRIALYDPELSVSDEMHTTVVEEAILWLDDTSLAEARVFQARVAPFSAHISARISLSRCQEHILSALLLLAPSFLAAKSKDDLRYIKRLESVPELRSLVPYLSTLHERADGTGPMGMKREEIPLLARIVAVLVSADGLPHFPALRDSGAFDPELLRLAREMDIAA